MARPKSENKRNAILASAARVIVTHGLSAPTALIAQEAGVANGSLFTYFETKSDLLNQLYLEIKTEMANEALRGVNEDGELREQMARVWSNWMNWALANPEKRKALAQLGVSDELTEDTRNGGHLAMAKMGLLLERCRAEGPMQDAPREFVVEIMSSIADATMDYMSAHPESADADSRAAFEALWRMIA
jgi:AcrR family transcriptional regulator